VIFDGRVPISVLRNKQLFKKKKDVKTSHFQFVQIFLFSTPAILRKDRPWKKYFFFRANFSCEQDGQPNFKFNVVAEVLFIYRLIPRKPDLFGRYAILDTIPIGRILRVSWSVHGRTQQKC
jgi:hypothetical protein